MVLSFLHSHTLIAGGELSDVNTVRLQRGAAIFPCYSTAAATSRVAIVEHHTAARNSGATMLPDAKGRKGGQSVHPTCCVLNDYNA